MQKNFSPYIENPYNPAWSRDHPGLKFHTMSGDAKKNPKKFFFSKFFFQFFFFFFRFFFIDFCLMHSGHYDPNLVLWSFFSHLDFEETNFHPCCSNSKPLGNEFSHLKIKETHIGWIFFSELINVWSLIRSCWLEKNLQINTRVVMLIRATRVFGSYNEHMLMDLSSSVRFGFEFWPKRIRD